MTLKRKNKSTKNHNINIHFKRRMQDRHGIILNSTMRKEIVKYIQSGQAKKLEKQSNARGTYEIPFLDCLKVNNPDCTATSLIVVYDRKRKRLVTTLFPEGVYNLEAVN